MLVKGKVVSGVMRGEQLIDKYSARLKGVIGFEPFPGTLNVKLERKIDLKFYATKTLEHKLLHGGPFVECYLAPVKIHKGDEEYKCWALRQEKPLHGADIIELVAKDNLRDKLSLQDGDEVEIEFPDVSIQGKEEREGILQRFYAKETRLSR